MVIRRSPEPSEFQSQVGVADALRIACAPGWLWTHFPAGELRHPAVAGRLKAMGLQRGWSDFLLVSPGGKLHALEMKKAKGKLTPDQELFRDAMIARNLPWAVAHDIMEALDVLIAWGALSKLRIRA